MDVIRALFHPWALGLTYIHVRLEKGAAARCLSRQNFRTSFGGLRKSALIWCLSSTDVWRGFSLIIPLLYCLVHFHSFSFQRTFCHYFDFPVIPANAGISFSHIKFLYSASLSKRVNSAAKCGLFWIWHSGKGYGNRISRTCYSLRNGREILDWYKTYEIRSIYFKRFTK